MAGEGITLMVTKGHCRGAAAGDVYPDDILRAPEDLKVDDARRMIAIGYAVEIPGEEERSDEDPAPEVAPGTVEHRDPGITHGDPETSAPPAVKVKPPKRPKKKTRGSGK